LVSKIQNIAVSNTAPVNGQVLKFNGAQWVPATDDIGTGGGSNPTVLQVVIFLEPIRIQLLLQVLLQLQRLKMVL
jgi:hypothetical protein